ncbi:MAG TPA: hypothetical protein VGZ02_06565 [Candidatus Baltobacteraceae bacterium]|jgi:hypothetical protein|nr:hypothetical protein [Candidatus Baltobacteraceae bacterium]
MFNEVENLVQRVTTGEIDPGAVSQAAGDHVSSIPSEQLGEHLQTAVQNANNSGQTDIAQQLVGLLQQHETGGQGLQQQVASLISSNPQILQYFEPEFVRNILAKV